LKISENYLLFFKKCIIFVITLELNKVLIMKKVFFNNLL